MATGFSLKYGFSVCGVCGGHGGGAVHAMEPTTPLPVSCMLLSLLYGFLRYPLSTLYPHHTLHAHVLRRPRRGGGEVACAGWGDSRLASRPPPLSLPLPPPRPRPACTQDVAIAQPGRYQGDEKPLLNAHLLKFIQSQNEHDDMIRIGRWLCSPLISTASLLIELTSSTPSISSWSRLVPPLTSATVMPMSRAPGDCVGTATAAGINILRWN